MWLVYVTLAVALARRAGAPPVTAGGEGGEGPQPAQDDLAQYMEYHRYLKEVVAALEGDREFRARLEAADDADVRSGRVAEHLDFVGHGVRSRLDEIKRQELERLRHLADRQRLLADPADPTRTPGHVDHANPHTFEVEDLKRLIHQTTLDLDAADKERKDQFKEYEMAKEFEKQQKLEKLDEEHKKEYKKELQAEEEAKKHHKPLHHPGSKRQLEEVWEKQDHMEQQFDPKAFFMMHDVDGNGVWDADEVKALFIKELDKMYGPGAPNQDKRERAEEMERMREHVFAEADRNHDGLIDYQEFVKETRKPDFNKDPGWQPLDENQVYSQAEYHEFERRRLEEIRYLQSLGLVDAYGRAIPGAEQQVYAAQQAYHQQQQQRAWQQHQQSANQHPGQYPLQGQVPPLQHAPAGYQPPPHQAPAGYQPPPQQAPAGYQAPPPQAQQPQTGYQPPPQQVYQQQPYQSQQNYQGQPSPPLNQGQPQYQAQAVQPPNQVSQQPNQVPQQPNQVPQQPNQGRQQPNQVPQQPNQVPAQPQNPQVPPSMAQPGQNNVIDPIQPKDA